VKHYSSSNLTRTLSREKVAESSSVWSQFGHV